MKKSVEITLIIALAAVFLASMHGARTITGLQGVDVSQLPAPPSPPGMFESTEQPTTPEPQPETTPAETPATGTGSEQTTNVPPTPTFPAATQPTSSIGLENRVAALENQMNTLTARVDTLQSNVDAYGVDAANFRQFMGRPLVDQPAFIESVESANAASRNAVLGIILSVLAMLLVAGLVAMNIIQKKKEVEENKQLLVEYLDNYSKEGYGMETLQMHLRASGWPDELIQEAIDELKKPEHL